MSDSVPYVYRNKIKPNEITGTIYIYDVHIQCIQDVPPRFTQRDSSRVIRDNQILVFSRASFVKDNFGDNSLANISVLLRNFKKNPFYFITFLQKS